MEQLILDNFLMFFLGAAVVFAGFLVWMYARSPWAVIHQAHPLRRVPNLAEYSDYRVPQIDLGRASYGGANQGEEKDHNYVIPTEKGLILITRAHVFSKKPIHLPWSTVRRVKEVALRAVMIDWGRVLEIRLEVKGRPYLMRLQTASLHPSVREALAKYER